MEIDLRLVGLFSASSVYRLEKAADKHY